MKIKNILEKEDFIVITKSIYDNNKSPEVYISKQIGTPNITSEQNKIVMCSVLGEDICIFPYEQIQNGDMLHVGVYCIDICSYSVEFVYSIEQKLQINQQITTWFRSSKLKVYILYIPYDIDIQRIIISVIPQDIKHMNKPFTFRIQSPNGNVQIKNGWQHGQVGILMKGQHQFCINCTFTIIIETQDNLVFRIQPFVEKQIGNLVLNTRRYDAIDLQQIITYNFDLTKHTNEYIQSIHIDVIPYQGQFGIFVNPGHLPSRLYDYQYNATVDNKIDFTFHKSDQQKQQYYITIKSEEAATFSILVHTGNNQGGFLNFNTVEKGELEINQKINYKLLIQTSKSTNITIKLETYIGYGDLYIKRCKGPQRYRCIVTNQDIQTITQSDNISNQDMYIYQIKHQQQHTTQFTFLHDMSICGFHVSIGISISQCIYSIAIQAQQSVQSVVNYQLTVQQQEIPINLEIGKTQRWDLQQHEVHIYYFVVPTYIHLIHSVQFHFTKLTGSAQVYTSRINKNPSEFDYEKKISGDDEDIIYTNSDNKLINNTQYTLNSQFYIRITTPNESCYYAMLVTIQRLNLSEQQKFLQEAIQLVEGSPLKMQLQEYNNNQMSLFYFDVNLLYDYQGEIIVHLQTIQGQLDLYITNNNTVPSPDNYAYNMNCNQHELIISQYSLHFRRKTRYYVGVYPQNNDTHIHTFLIYYTLSQNIVQLPFGHMLTGTIQPLQFKYYRILVNPIYQQILISQSTQSNNIYIYISLNKNDPIPTVNNYNLSTQSSKTGVLRVNQEQIKQVCSQVTQQCNIILGVYNPSNILISYGVVVHHKYSINTLYNGYSFDYAYPDPHEYYRFQLYLYYNNINLPIVIIANSQHGPLEMYGLLYDKTIKNLNQYNIDQWPSNETNSMYVSTQQTLGNSQSIIVMQSTLQICKPHCVLAITLKSTETVQSINQNIDVRDIGSLDQKDFTISVTQDIHNIREGMPTRGYVQKGGIIYYQFNMNRKQATILISLTPVSDGDPDLVVDFGVDKRPTYTNYRWASESYKSEHLYITKQDFQQYEQMEGIYTIGVIGYQDTTYRLTVMYENEKVADILSGITYEFTVQQQTDIYLQYFHSTSDSIKINFLRETGHIELYVTTYQKSQDFIEQLPSKNNKIWSSSNNNISEQLIISKTHKQFCGQCWYLIGIHSVQQQSKVSLQLSQDNSWKHLQNGKVLYDIITSNETEGYIYELTSVDDDIQIHINIIQGQPIFYIQSELYYYSFQLNKSQYILQQDNMNSHIYLNIPKSDVLSHFQQCNRQSQLIQQKCKVIQNYYFLAKSIHNVTSVYSILIKTRTSLIILRDGVLHSTSIQPNQTQTYVYYASRDTLPTDKAVILLRRDTHSPNYELLPNIHIYYEELQQRTGDLRNDQPLKQPKILSQSNDSVLEGYSLTQIQLEPGRFLIKVINQLKVPIDYNIIVHSKELIILPINTVQYNVLTENNAHYYQIYPDKPGDFVLEVQSCLGDISQNVATSIDNLLNNVQNNSINISTYNIRNSHIYTVIQQRTTIYTSIQYSNGAKLTLNNGQQIDEAIYSIRAMIRRNEQETDHAIFKAGNNGEMQYEITDTQHKKVKLTFMKPVVSAFYINGTFTENKHTKNIYNNTGNYHIYYILYVTSNKEYGSILSKCGGIYSLINKGQTKLDTKHQYNVISCESNTLDKCTTQIHIKLTNSNNVYYTTIRAYILNHRNGLHTTIGYNTLEILFSTPNDQNLYTFIIILLLFLLILFLSLIAAKIYQILNKHKTLSFELQNINNLATFNKDDAGDRAEQKIEKIKYGNFNDESV